MCYEETVYDFVLQAVEAGVVVVVGVVEPQQKEDMFLSHFDALTVASTRPVLIRLLVVADELPPTLA